MGLPDQGKGQIISDMAARVTRGLEWPCGEGVAPKGKVVVLSSEDNADTTIVPRLAAAGADLTQVEIVGMVEKPVHTDRMFSLVTDLDLLGQKVLAIGDVKLILIDPLSAYLGGGVVNSFSTPEVRAVLSPMVALAAELKVAIVGIMHFNKKAEVDNVVLRVSDSLAFAATARAVFAAIDDPENKRKLFVRGKCNIAKSDIKALAYVFKTREVGNDPDTGEVIEAPYINWFPQHVDISATEAMQAAGSKKPGALEEAKQFLQELLKNGPVLQTEVEAEARANDVSVTTLRRAKKALQVDARKDGPEGANGQKSWRWHPP